MRPFRGPVLALFCVRLFPDSMVCTRMRVCRLLWLGTPNLLGAYVACGKCALANSRRVFFYPGNLQGREIGRTRRKGTREYRQPASHQWASHSAAAGGCLVSWKGDDGFFPSIFFPRFWLIVSTASARRADHTSTTTTTTTTVTILTVRGTYVSYNADMFVCNADVFL